MEDMKERKLDRRTFIKGGIATGVVGAAGALFAGCAPKASPSAQEAGSEVESSGEALTAKGLETRQWSFQIPPAAPDESIITRTETADIIVVGAGTSGLATAVSASEQGARVILVSASKGNVSRGGSNHAVYSKVMEAQGIERYDVDSFFRSQMIAAGYNIDQEK